MQSMQYQVRESLRCYVNGIMTDESPDPAGSLTLPIYADGYPGIMYQKTKNGFMLLPRGKKLSELFLYGQTLDPISLQTQGPYQLSCYSCIPLLPNTCWVWTQRPSTTIAMTSFR